MSQRWWRKTVMKIHTPWSSRRNLSLSSPKMMPVVLRKPTSPLTISSVSNTHTIISEIYWHFLQPIWTIQYLAAPVSSSSFLFYCSYYIADTVFKVKHLLARRQAWNSKLKVGLLEVCSIFINNIASNLRTFRNCGWNAGSSRSLFEILSTKPDLFELWNHSSTHLWWEPGNNSSGRLYTQIASPCPGFGWS